MRKIKEFSTDVLQEELKIRERDTRFKNASKFMEFEIIQETIPEYYPRYENNEDHVISVYKQCWVVRRDGKDILNGGWEVRKGKEFGTYSLDELKDCLKRSWSREAKKMKIKAEIDSLKQKLKELEKLT